MLQGVPCQDRAFSTSILDGQIFAAVADGCSGATGKSDIGAQAVIDSCHRALDSGKSDTEECFGGEFFVRLYNDFRETRVDKDPEDYYASLVALRAVPEGLQFYVFGDGAFAVVSDDGSIELTTIDWWHNRPYYLAYRDDACKSDSLSETFRAAGIDPVREVVTRFLPKPSAIDVISQSERWRPFTDFERGCTYKVDLTGIRAKAAAVMTDGITRFNGASAVDVTARLLDFSYPKADFARHQLISTLTRFAGRGHFALDDVAIACVLLGS